MPYRDDLVRTKNYEVGVIPDNIRSTFTAKLPSMLNLQESEQAKIVKAEQCAREKLDKAGIMANFRIPYLNFVRAIYRGSGHNRDVALTKIVTAEKAKFVQYGLDATLLTQCAACIEGVAEY